jgi:hypothetical protein
MSASSEPKRVLPLQDWEHSRLYRDIREAIYSLPAYFKTETNIEGISATDIFTLNTALGATIESQVVESLNRMRSVWDPAGNYALYHFVRQSQTFPDVLLTKASDEALDEKGWPKIILGIELKGWYLLAKEGEPSFRYKVTPSACALQDMIVVVPWALSNVIAGSPKIFTPYIESSKYAAEYRNYWWAHVREAQSNNRINSPNGISPYPRKSDQISDEPAYDRGGNFGRYSRTGIMNDYLERASSQALCGIRADHWRSFFKLFQDQKDESVIAGQIASMKNRIMMEAEMREEKREVILNILTSLENLNLQ